MDLVGTHQRCLIGAALRTTGAMLELGVGWYSTPLLHELAVAQKRYLRTIDNNEHWLNQFKSLQCDSHDLQLVGWWGHANFVHSAGDWGIVFVDNGQPIEREYAIRRLLNNASIFVMHDTDEGFAYGYDRVLPMFKWSYTDRCQKTWTTVASNRVDVSEWFVDLPPVEPGTGVT